MGALPQFIPVMTVAEYLEFELLTDKKHEYVDGEVYAMSGASAAHVDISGNLFASLHAQFRTTNCTVHNSEMRVKVLATGNYFYPDLSIVCGQRELSPETSAATLLNPTVLIEVLSPSTELYDRTTKFFQYQRLPSLQDYILVSQNEPRLECFSRGSDATWILSQATTLDTTLRIPSLELDLALNVIYENITFPDPEAKQDEATE